MSIGETMADNIKVGIDVNDNGSAKKLLNNIQEVRREADKLNESAAKVNFQGTSGSRKLAAAADPKASFRDYGTMHGTSGGTGASARDFANESQGLGGLVRLYATYAANVFAVGAAFRALREAAGTEIITRGLEQMGVAGGRSLTGLSQQVVRLTDGAVSLREAMTSVAQASSAGMNTKQIQDLAIVANKASNALGLNMSDALSRLSRGITKIEPELLDELGIFVRVDKASQDYAMSVGKTAATLSDFEKRQAFANAVLAQGKDKFKEIAEVSNPYDKLLASITDLGTKALNLLNKGLEPIARIMAESPGALTAVFIALGATIVQKALPAIGQLRAGLAAASEDRLKSVEKFNEQFGDKYQTILEKQFNLTKLRESTAAAQKEFEKINASANAATTKMAASAQTVASGKFSAEDLENANKVLARKNKIVEEGIKGKRQATEAEKALAAQEAKTIAAAIAYGKQKSELNKAEEEAQTVADKPTSKWDAESLNMAKYVKLKKGLDMANAVSNAAETAQIAGIKTAWSLLNKEIAEKGITGIDKYTTLAKGGFSAVLSRLGQFTMVLGQVGAILSTVIGVWELFDAAASSANKEQAAFSESISSTKNAIDTSAKTLDLYISKKHDAFSLQAVLAFATSLGGISSGLDESIKKFEEWKNKAGWLDNLKDKFASIYGGSNLQTLQQTLGNSVTQVVKTLQVSSVNASSQISSIAKVMGLSFNDVANRTEEFEQKLRKLNEADISNINRQLESISKSEQSAAQAVQAFKESLNALDKTVTEVGNATQLQGLEGKLGTELVAASNKLAIALKDPLKSFSTLEDMAKDPKMAALLGGIIKPPSISSEDLTKQLKVIEDAKAKFEKFKEDNSVRIANDGLDAKQTKQQTELHVAIIDSEKKLTGLRAQAIEYAKQQFELISKMAEKGLEYADKALKYAKEQAALTVAQAQTGVLAKAGADTAQREYDITIKQINIQETLAMSNFSLQKAVIDNTHALQDSSAIQNYLNARKAEKDTSTSQNEREQARMLAESLKPMFEVATYNARKEPGGHFSMSPEALQIMSARSSESVMLNKSIEATKAGFGAQRDVAGITKDTKVAEEELRRQERALSLDKAKNDLKSQYIKLAEQIAGTSTKELIDTNTRVQLDQNDLVLKGQLAKIEEQRKLLASAPNEEANKSRKKQLDDEEASARNVKEASDYVTNFNKRLAEQDLLRKETIDKQALSLKTEELAVSKAEELNKVKSFSLDIAAQLGVLSDQSVAKARGELEIENQKLQYKQTAIKLADAETNARKLLEDTNSNIAKVEEDMATASGAKLEALTSTLNALNKSKTAQQESLNLATAERTQSQAQQDALIDRITKQTEINALTAKWNDISKESVRFAEALKDAFGSAGEAISGVVDVMLKMGEAQEKYEKAKAKTTDPEKLAEIEKKYNSDQVANNTKLLASSKKMFTEKSAGYKMLNGLEKANNALVMFNQAKELAGTIASVAKAIKSYIPGIYASFMENLGPWGIGAATAAIAAFLGASGGGSTPDFTMDSKQRQETQGTGSTYVANPTDPTQGMLVGTGKGVFGDIRAKSESIAHTLDMIKNNQVDGLEQDSDMLKALKKLDLSIINVAKNLPSFQTNLGGVSEGTSTSGGFLGISALWGSTTTTEITGAGLEVTGSFLDIAKSAKGLIKVFQDVKTTSTSSGFLGLFGGGTSTSVSRMFPELAQLNEKQLTAVSDMFAQGASSIAALSDKLDTNPQLIVDALDSVQVTGTIDLKGKTQEEVSKELQNMMSSYMDDVVSKLYPQLVETFRKAGEGAYETVSRVIDTNEKITQAVQNINSVTPDLSNVYAVTEALAAGAGGLDKFVTQYNYFVDNFMTKEEKVALKQSTVNKVFDKFNITGVRTASQFAKVVKSIDLTTSSGQEMYQALMDVAPAFKDVADSLETSLKAIIDQYDTFAKSLMDYRDSLLLGSTSVLTPEQKYKESQTQFDTTYAKAMAGDKAAQSKLTNVSNAFLEASRTYNASSDQYTKDFYNVITKVNDAIAFSEAQKSDAQLQLDATNTQTDILASIDVNSAATADLMQEVLKGSKSGTVTASKTATNIVAKAVEKGVTSGSRSIGDSVVSAWDSMTKEERSAYYAANPTEGKIVQAAQDAFGMTTLGALSKAIDPVGWKEKQLIAAGNYSGQLGADGMPIGAKELAAMTESLSAAAAATTANTEATVAQTAATESSGTYSSGWSGYSSSGWGGATGGTDGSAANGGDTGTRGGFAKGGYASRGRHVVGELGPEIVDFKTPGRVYTAKETFGMFNGGNANAALIQEVQELRKEIVNLQKQQQEQTGHLIEATYDSQNQNAEQVSDTISNTSAKQQWAAKVKDSVKIV